jgi:hypothetical protein
VPAWVVPLDFGNNNFIENIERLFISWRFETGTFLKNISFTKSSKKIEYRYV